MITVQAAGCAPIVRAWEAGKSASEMWIGAETFASGLRVPKAYGDYLILDILKKSQAQQSRHRRRDSRGHAALGQRRRDFRRARRSRVACRLPEAARERLLRAEDKVVLFNTGSAYKYLDMIEAQEKRHGAPNRPHATSAESSGRINAPRPTALPQSAQRAQSKSVLLSLCFSVSSGVRGLVVLSDGIYSSARLLPAAARAMVRTQLAERGIRDARLLDAIRTVPRHEFVPESLQQSAYGEHPLPIGEDQTISQPYIVAAMLERLALQPEDRVLEVGTGTGYVTALLSLLCAEVYSVERHANLAAAAQRTLQKLGVAM